MKNESVFIETTDKQKIFLRKHFPACEVKGIIQILHGMAEHSGRYDEFIDFLLKNGYAVYVHDMRGHGKTAGSLDEYGYLGGVFKWETLVSDARRVTEIALYENPGKKLFILGHSMGSMVLRRYMERFRDGYSGVILSGANGIPSISELAALKIALLQMLFFGKRHRSNLIYKLQYNGYNSSFNPKPTMFEWLSRDRERVDNYANDPFCGGPFTASFYFDMIFGYFRLAKPYEIKKTNTKIPIYFISGAKDPVGNFTKGVKQFASLYTRFKAKDIEINLYPDCRHEVLNELNRKEIYKDIIEWINKHN
ncbi:MAG: lysophospholipase [bacterium]